MTPMQAKITNDTTPPPLRNRDPSNELAMLDARPGEPRARAAARTGRGPSFPSDAAPEAIVLVVDKQGLLGHADLLSRLQCDARLGRPYRRMPFVGTESELLVRCESTSIRLPRAFEDT